MFILFQKKHCMCVFNKEQMFQLLSESESRLIERMDVGSGNHESQVIRKQIKVLRSSKYVNYCTEVIYAKRKDLNHMYLYNLYFLERNQFIIQILRLLQS